MRTFNRSLNQPWFSDQEGQLKFPATQNASADENTLDDYEEGTWTPSVGGTATYTSQVGIYTKVGRLVCVHCKLIINTIGTGSTNTIFGFPFQPGSTGVSSYSGAVGLWTATATAIVGLSVNISQGSTSFVMNGQTAAATTFDGTINILGNSTEVRFSLKFVT